MIISIKKEIKNKYYLHSKELSSVLDEMKNVNHSSTIDNFRYNLHFMEDKKAKAVARKIPKVIFSGTVIKQGEDLSIKKYNGIVLLEINSLVSMEEAIAVREMVSHFPQTLAAFVGSSGQSVKFLVRFIRSDGSLPEMPEEVKLFHEHAYRWAARYYQGELDYKIDFKEPIVDRACRLSFDPNLYFAPDALPMTLAQPTQSTLEKTISKEISTEERLLKVMPDCKIENVYSVLFENSLLSAIQKVGANWRDEKDSLYIQIAKSCFHSGVPQERVVRGLIDHFECKPQELELRMVINNTYEIEKGFGKKLSMSNEQLMALRTDEFMKRRYEFRYNTQLCEVEYRERESFHFNFEPITDRVLNSIALNALTEGLQLWDRDVKRYVYSDRVKNFTPIEDYLAHLPEWDGKNHINSIANCVPTDNPLWQDAFHRWFLCMVAHWQGADKTHANSTSPILIGEQGYRKSTFCRALVPPELRRYYTDSIDFGKKRDTELFLNRFALINIDEFDQISVSQQGFLKHILQKPVVNLRKPNQSNVQELRRYASFIGTSNHHDLLTDTSGSRRFICIDVKAPIKMHAIQYKQLYAQALHEINAGTRYWFDYEDEMAMTESNNQFGLTTPAEQLFQQYFRAPSPEEDGEYLLASEIYSRLQKLSSFKLSPTKMIHFGRILNKLLIPTKRLSNGTLYCVMER